MVNVFCGFLFDENKEKQLIHNSRTGVQTAANQYQQGFLSGILDEVQIISSLSVGIFPKGNTQLVFKAEKCSSAFGTIEYLPFVNLHIAKDLCFELALKRKLSQLLKKEDKVFLFVYSLYRPFLKAITSLKKRYGDRLQVCLIVPDLPGKYGIMRKWNSLGGLRDRLESEQKMRLACNADSYVFLTESMRELFPPKPYTVIEGFLPGIQFDYSQKRLPKLILYTGSLNPNYGILELIDAFSQIEDPEYQLWICGAGGVENEIKKRTERDSRIKYWGFLSKEKITKLQAQCDILVNPRTPEGEYTKYSFPSKTMEYLLSGSKVVMHRLPGVPNDYYRFIQAIESDDNTDLKNMLLKAGNDTAFYPEKSREQVRWICEKNDTLHALVSEIIK